jgi:hypothetical protein
MRLSTMVLLAAAPGTPRPVLADEDAADRRERETRLCRQELERDRKGKAKGTRENGKGRDWHERCAALLAPPPPAPVPPPVVVPPTPVPPPESGVTAPVAPPVVPL